LEAIMSAETPPEAEILDDLALGTDLKAKVTQAWREFAADLAEAMPALPAGAHIDIALDPTASGTGDAVYGVTLRRIDEAMLGGFAIGNASLPDGYRLDRAAVADLVALGWSPPGVVDGSRENFGLVTPVGDATRVAVIVARTLRDIYGAPHPAFLTYSARANGETQVTVPPLGTARSLQVPDDAAEEEDYAAALAGRLVGDDPDLPLADRVQAVVASLLRTTPDALQVDGDGDIGIRSGSAMVFVRVRDNPPLVDVFSPVLTEIEPTEQLYVKLSELTNRMPIGRLYCTNDTVWASVPVFGRDFQSTHLMLAVQVMTGLADELDDRLHGEFGGKRFFGEGDKPAEKGEGERTGMYL
jgi:T3SS (YopN, CesT) and YbjN peptide-binding chaperone 1/T3SS (YopN, CesT) and YbjN peptide-binding chaperone 3